MAQRLNSRGAKALGASLAVGLGMTACSRDYTVAYVYVPSATKTSAGVINEYAVDYLSGALTPLASSGIATGNNPIGLVASPNQQNLYVIDGSAPSSNVIHYTIGTDGKLYAANTYSVVQNANATIVGTNPTALAIDPAGKFLYITFLYQNGFTTASPGPGGIAIYPINSDGSLGSPLLNGTLPYVPVGNHPAGVVVNPKAGTTPFVYVIDQETSSAGTPFGVLLTFVQQANGSLVLQPGPVASGSVSGVAAGTIPAGIAEDPTGQYIYVTDEITNQLYGFQVSQTLTVALNSSPFATGNFPLGVTVDPRGEYVYVANYGSSSVSAFAINTANGALSSVTGSAATTVATGPTCVTIEPALGVYLYTSNQEDNSVTGEKLSANTGTLSQVQGTPFPAAALPTCAASVANGAHATQLVD